MLWNFPASDLMRFVRALLFHTRQLPRNRYSGNVPLRDPRLLWRRQRSIWQKWSLTSEGVDHEYKTHFPSFCSVSVAKFESWSFWVFEWFGRWPVNRSATETTSRGVHSPPFYRFRLCNRSTARSQNHSYRSHGHIYHLRTDRYMNAADRIIANGGFATRATGLTALKIVHLLPQCAQEPQNRPVRKVAPIPNTKPKTFYKRFRYKKK